MEESKLKIITGVQPSEKDEAYFLCQVVGKEVHKEVSVEIPEEIHKILMQYDDLFVEPIGLPPPRKHDHLITLKEGSNPVTSNPYKCPYIQNNEIEKIVKEMLESGIIRHSSSPFASPVLLVKKKDHSRRLSVDYRALNTLTVKKNIL